jgi:hypothetical protein
MTPGPDCIFLPKLSERPQLIRQRLPPGLLRSDIQGAVRLSFVVDTTGQVLCANCHRAVHATSAVEDNYSELARHFHSES